MKSTSETSWSQVVRRFDVIGPARQERNPMAAVPNIKFTAAKMIAGKMSQGFQGGNICHRRAAVVAGKDHEGIVGHSGLVEGGENLADAIVAFHDIVPIGTQTALAGPLRRRHERSVGRWHGEIEEEGFAGVCP